MADGPGSRREQRYEGRDLAVTTDFRAVFAEVVEATWGCKTRSHVFPGFKNAGRARPDRLIRLRLRSRQALRYTHRVQITDLRTPCVLVDHQRVERNIERMQAAAMRAAFGCGLTRRRHKCPDLARVQIGRGAVGICCAKLGEAEVFADAGIADIRLPYPLNPVNADACAALLDRTHISFIVDHMDVARGWSEAMRQRGTRGRRAREGRRRVPPLRHRSARA